MSDVFPFEDLVFDIQIYIIAMFVPPEDLLSLTVVSRYINSLATPLLYSDIRLLFGILPPRDSSKLQGAFTETLVSAQRAFTTQILAHRERAGHVRNLAWQIGTGCGPTFMELFPLMDKLTRVHLVHAHPTHMKEINLDIPALFPRVRAVKFTGTTSLSFALPILHSPHRLTAISLDTINPQSVAVSMLEWVIHTDLPCLRTFSFRASSQTRSTQPWDVSRETGLFSTLRDALSSSRCTLEGVTLGLKAENPALAKDASPLLSSERFARTVLPLFWEEQWPMLKILQLEGIDVEVDDATTRRRCGELLHRSVPQVVADPLVQCVQRFWSSQSMDKF